MNPVDLKIVHRIDRGDYIIARVPGHPHGDHADYVYEHRYVVERHLNRFLLPKEVVHHKNGNAKDNRIGNLEVHTSGSHSVKHHAKKYGNTHVKVRCVECGAWFWRTRAQSINRRTEKHYCSRKCRSTRHGRLWKYRTGCRCAACREANRLSSEKYRKHGWQANLVKAPR